MKKQLVNLTVITNTKKKFFRRKTSEITFYGCLISMDVLLLGQIYALIDFLIVLSKKSVIVTAHTRFATNEQTNQKKSTN